MDVTGSKPAELLAMQSYISAAAGDVSLYEETNFDQRVEAIDFICFGIIDRVDTLLPTADQPDALLLLRVRAEKVQAELEAVDTRLFQRLRATIRTTGLRGKRFRELVSAYTHLDPDNHTGAGYNNLDLFINGLSPFQAIPEQTRELEPEMVYYQKTPASVIFRLATSSFFTEEDIFVDLGAGLGQVAILVHLLAGIPARGIEIEPAFCRYAKDCAAALNLPGVTFMNADARTADYSNGTVFFMFTPFTGEIMQEVLAILQKASQRRKIRIITYGPCTAHVALQSWLQLLAPEADDMYQPAVFTSY